MHDERTNDAPDIEPELGMLEQSLASWEAAIDARWRRITDRAARIRLLAGEATEAATLVRGAEQRVLGVRELRRVMLEKRRTNARILDAHASEVELVLERARHVRPTPAAAPPPVIAAAPVPKKEPAPASPAASPMAAGVEQRRHRRASLAVDVTLSSEHNFFVGFAENISEGGLFIATHKLLPMGSPVDLTFRLPTGGPIEVHCVVRWIRQYNTDSDTPPGLGVEFVDLPENDRLAVIGFLQQRDPLFYALATAPSGLSQPSESPPWRPGYIGV